MHGPNGPGTASRGRTTNPDPTSSIDRLASLVRRTLRAPVALVSIVGLDEVVLPGAEGLPEPWQSSRRTPHDLSICRFVAADDAPLRISDARTVAGLAGTGAVTELGVVAYCGVPLITQDGAVIGALCAIDTVPRTWTDDDVAVLVDLAAIASLELTLREQTLVAQVGQQRAEDETDSTALLLALSEALTDTETVGDIAEAVTEAARTALGTVDVHLRLVDERERRLDVVPVTGRAVDAPVVALDGKHPAGWSAVHREPLFLPDAPTARASFPADAIQHEAAAHLPLEVAGELLGTLCLLWAGARTFDAADRAPMLALARYTAEATARAQLLAERRGAATVLQQAMLTELPTLAAGELAARYLPSNGRNQVGGDWYDAFVTAEGTLTLAIGDVTGHDVAAAATMGQLRSLLRAYSWPGGRSPAEVLTAVDHAVEGLQMGSMATVLLAELTPPPLPGGPTRVRWSNAGHQPPVVVPADGAVTTWETAAELLLGVDPTRPRTDHTAELAPGDLLLLVTDGIVEQDHRTIDDGTAMLLDQVRSAASLPAADLLDALVIPIGTANDDDIALLAHRVPPAP